MITSRIIGWLHLLWGLSLLIMLEVPRPFGAFEPFFTVLSVTETGILLMMVGILAFATPLTARPVLAALLLVPQQLVLLYPLFFGVASISTAWDGRLWLNICFQLIFAIYHGREIAITWAAVHREQ